jgi:hypothetical protein
MSLASERLLCTDRMRYIWSETICGLSMESVLVRFPLQDVHRFESPRLSDMTNHLFVAVSK